MIKGIVCIGANRVMGNKGTMPWGDKPLDGANFRRLTEGHTVVMGRKTFESMGRKRLPNRHNIIVSRDVHSNIYYSDIKGIVELYKQGNHFEGDLWIIGGAQIYEAFLPYIEEFYVTTVGEEFEGDTYFPDIHATYEWQGELLGGIEEKDGYRLTYRKFTRKK